MQKNNEVKVYNSDIDKQIEHWRERATGLEEWKKTHDYNHPDWAQNSRDLNNAYVKIEQLKQRKSRKPVDVGETYSIPNN